MRVAVTVLRGPYWPVFTRSSFLGSLHYSSSAGGVRWEFLLLFAGLLALSRWVSTARALHGALPRFFRFGCPSLFAMGGPSARGSLDGGADSGCDGGGYGFPAGSNTPDFASDWDDCRPLGLPGLPVTLWSTRWLRMADFGHDVRMDVWCATVLLRVYMRMYGPWAPFLQRWHRFVLMALSAMQTRNMGVPYPFGTVPPGFLGRPRRS